jgi:hypothetical protein
VGHRRVGPVVGAIDDRAGCAAAFGFAGVCAVIATGIVAPRR